MEISRISDRATAYLFHELDHYLTVVLLIACRKKAFLIDTFCGPDSMRGIAEQIHETMREKQLYVINTHAHWDHFWGNCSFGDNVIISHELCRSIMDQTWEEQISINRSYLMGKVEKCLPNLTFQGKMTDYEEGIEIFHSPGHTTDSISVFDHEEQNLYVGDNLELPIVHVESPNVETYIQTLNGYLDYKPQKIIAGHTLYLTQTDIIDTIHYLEGLQKGVELHFTDPYVEQIHQANLKTVRQ